MKRTRPTLALAAASLAASSMFTIPTLTPAAHAAPTPAVTTQASKAPAGIPGKVGKFATPIRLQHQGKKADHEISAWKTRPWYFGFCGTKQVRFPSLKYVVASRSIGAQGPEYVASEAAVQFTNRDRAKQFMTELRKAAARCDGSRTEEMNIKIRYKFSNAVEGPWSESIALRSWSTISFDGGKTYVLFPGGDVTFVGRQGRFVALSASYGEFVGDPWRDPGTRDANIKAVKYVMRQI